MPRTRPHARRDRSCSTPWNDGGKPVAAPVVDRTSPAAPQAPASLGAQEARIPLTRAAMAAWPRYREACERGSAWAKRQAAASCSLGAGEVLALERLWANLQAAGHPRDWFTAGGAKPGVRKEAVDRLLAGLAPRPGTARDLARACRLSDLGVLVGTQDALERAIQKRIDADVPRPAQPERQQVAAARDEGQKEDAMASGGGKRQAGQPVFDGVVREIRRRRIDVNSPMSQVTRALIADAAGCSTGSVGGVLSDIRNGRPLPPEEPSGEAGEASARAVAAGGEQSAPATSTEATTHPVTVLRPGEEPVTEQRSAEVTRLLNQQMGDGGHLPVEPFEAEAAEKNAGALQEILHEIDAVLPGEGPQAERVRLTVRDAEELRQELAAQKDWVRKLEQQASANACEMDAVRQQLNDMTHARNRLDGELTVARADRDGFKRQSLAITEALGDYGADGRLLQEQVQTVVEDLARVRAEVEALLNENADLSALFGWLEEPVQRFRETGRADDLCRAVLPQLGAHGAEWLEALVEVAATWSQPAGSPTHLAAEAAATPEVPESAARAPDLLEIRLAPPKPWEQRHAPTPAREFPLLESPFPSNVGLAERLAFVASGVAEGLLVTSWELALDQRLVAQSQACGLAALAIQRCVPVQEPEGGAA